VIYKFSVDSWLDMRFVKFLLPNFRLVFGQPKVKYLSRAVFVTGLESLFVTYF
jgi:hypothetical protein